MKVKDIILVVFGFIFFTFNSVGLQVLIEEPEELSTILKYELTEDNKSYKVVGIEKSLKGDIIIPETYNNLPVSEIDWSSLKSTTMKNIVIPKYEEQIARINEVLEERDLEEHSRLKVIKNQKQK